MCLSILAAVTRLLVPTVVGGQPQGKSDTVGKNPESRDLHQIGERVTKAVLNKDIQTLLAYDRADLRDKDGVALKNPKSDLYCYIFDSHCMARSEVSWFSVYDKISRARQLGIKINLVQSSGDHQTYGNLTFYDRSSISERDLGSSDFLCKEYPQRIASWSFRLEEGKWTSVGLPFDYGTEYCDE